MTAAGSSPSLAFICSIYEFEFLAWMRWCHHPRHSTLTLPGHTGLHSAASMAAPAGRAAATGPRVHPLAWHPAQEQLWGWCCWPSIEKHHWDRVRVGYGSNIDCCNPPQAIMLKGNDSISSFSVLLCWVSGSPWAAAGSHGSRQAAPAHTAHRWEQQGFPQCLLGLGLSAQLVVVPGWYPAVG